MLKNFPLLLLLLPFSHLSADEANTSPTSTKADNAQQSSNNAALLSGQISTNTPRSSAYFFAQCYRNVPPLITDSNSQPIEQVPINIRAKKIHAIADTLSYQGDVQLTQGIKYLAADELTYFKEEERATASGNVNFVSGEITLYSDSVEARLDSEQTTLQQADYQFHGQGGRGSAQRIYDNGADLYEFKASSYSACPPGDNTWSLDATTLYIDNEKGVGSAYNAVLKIKDVPVFYLPYITYPTSDKRRTGLLFPAYEYSDTNGSTVTQPLYLNIAENMDATLTPSYMENRGTLLAAEYRYLFDIGTGKLAAEYLDHDRIREQNRYLYHWNHRVNFARNWKFTSNYSKVSDDNYFTDIDTNYGSRSDNQLLQTAKLSLTEHNWNSELEVRDFQILGDGDTPHKVLPKLAFNAYQPLGWKSLQLDWYSEVSRFDHDNDDTYTGTRIHLQPKLSLPLYYDSLFVNTELKYMLSFYQQTLNSYSDLEESVSRYIPSFKINSGINFERDLTAFGSPYKQTLVPQIQYLYVPYRDQSTIGTYDTTRMQQDYYALFRDNRFSGYDRIADANQITLGISSSILNAQSQEKMRFAVGQNYYFTPSRTELLDDDDEADTASRSSLIAEFDVNFADNYFFHAGIEWDSDENEISSANSALEKRWLYNTYAQLNYRYVAVSNDGDEEDLVNQLGSKINWSINGQWSSFASYYYDLEYQHLYESMIGIKYQSCCWSISLSYDKHMSAYYGDIDTIADDYESESSYEINFELKGLGGAGTGSNESLFNYGRPFYLQ